MICYHNGKPVGAAVDGMRHALDAARKAFGGRAAFHACVAFGQGACTFNLGGAPFTYAPDGIGAPVLPFDPAGIRRGGGFLSPFLPAVTFCDITTALATAPARAGSPATAEALGILSWDELPTPASPAQAANEQYLAMSDRAGDEDTPLLLLDGRARGEGELSMFSAAGGLVRSSSAACVIGHHVRLFAPGKWYFEVVIQADGVTSVGWAAAGFSPDTARGRGLGDDALSWGVDGARMVARHNRQQRRIGRHAWREGDVVGTLYDGAAGRIYFFINGVPLRDVADGGTNAGADGTDFLFEGVPPQAGLYPVVSLEPESAAVVCLLERDLTYLPPGARPVSAGGHLLRGIEAYLTGAEAIPSGTSRCTHEMLRLVANAVAADSEVEPNRPVVWARIAERLADVAPFDTVVEALKQLTRLTRLFTATAKITPCDVDHAALVAPHARSPLRDALDMARPFTLCSSNTVALAAYLRRTNGPGESNKLGLSRRRAADAAARFPPSQALDCASFQQRLNGSMLGQVFALLADRPPTLFVTSRRLYSVAFSGEGADDVGGPYRESIGGICAELTDALGGMPLLFAPTPNQTHALGARRDLWVPHPRCMTDPRLAERMLPLFYFVGMLMAGCLRGGELLPLAMPSAVWKALVGETPTLAEDMPAIDAGFVSTIRYLHDAAAGDADELQEAYDGNFTIPDATAGGGEVPLFVGGEDVPVRTKGDLRLYVRLWQDRKLHWEAANATSALARGFHSVVPAAAVRALSWAHLERAVCGRPDFSVDELAAAARYEGLTPQDRRVQWLWEALREFAPEERAMFARFISGRERLSSTLKLKLMPLHPTDALPPGGVDALLPHASTCFIWLSLPDYSCKEALADRLRYAVRNCVDIDADFRVRDAVDSGDGQVPRILRTRQNDENDFEDYSHLL
jgi:hypothetical protein